MLTSSSCFKITVVLALATLTGLPAAAAGLTSGPTSTVVYTGGNDLVIKSTDGKLLNYTVPSSYKFTAGGKQVSLSDLKPGTKLTAPVSTGFDPKVVTGVAVTKSKVFGVTPPDGVTLSLSEGIKEVSVPAGTTFVVGGKKLAVTDLKTDMMIDATIVTTAADGDSATATPAQSGALLVSNVAASEGGDYLPPAGTHLPLFAAIGAACLLLGFALLTFRKPVTGL